MPMFTKLHSIRSSLPFSFSSTQRSSSSPPTFETRQPTMLNQSQSYVSVTNLSRQQQHQQHQQVRQHHFTTSPSHQGPQRHRTISTPTISFTETLRVISKQVHQDQFDDVFGSFFFTDKRCHDRAIFMAARLLHNLGYDFVQRYPATHSFWKTVIDRFYTLNYLLFVVPSSERTRINYLAALEQHMAGHGNKAGLALKDRRGGMEIYFTFYYAAIQHQVTAATMDDVYDSDGGSGNNIAFLEQARRIVEHCLDSESKLGHAERDAMYIFHGLRAGFQFRDLAVVLIDDDDLLLAILQDAVRTNKNLTKQPYVNPFEDDACIVDSDDDDDQPDSSQVPSSGHV